MSGLNKISSLPDFVLCHILSFLPTKVAALTTILSKRWMGLWLSVPTLDFVEVDKVNYMDHLKFVFMIYNIIVQRDMSPVEKFTLRLSHSSWCCYTMVNTWVIAVLNRGAQHLDLYMPYLMDLPSATFGSRTLVSLKLAFISVNTLVTGGFPSLKILHLNEVVFRDEQCVRHLILGCPILEELFVEDLTIASSSNESSIRSGRELQSLNNLVNAVNIFCIPYIPLKWICKVKSLYLYDEFTHSFDFNCFFPNLTSLELIVDHYCWTRLINEVLWNCPNLQHFEIHHMHNFYDYPVGCEIWPHPKFVPECLSKHLRTCTLRKYQGWVCELHFSKYIMQNAKVLRIMRICSSVFSYPEEKFEVRRNLSMSPNGSPECKLHLNIK